jgi:uncharacterized protein (TIGR03437 family)
MLIRHCVFFWVLAGASLAQSPQSITVTSAASFQLGLPPPGSLATAFCTGFQVQGVIQATAYPLPRTLGGISITVGGAPAPILAVADVGGYQQINFEVPQEALVNPDAKTWTVSANQNGSKITAQVAMFQSPGDFFQIGNYRGAFQRGIDFSLVTEQNPARAGEVLVGYLTGLPGTEPVVPTGEAAPFSPLAVVPQPNGIVLVDQFAILLNGKVISNSCSTLNSPCPASNLLFLGLTPGMVGVYQVNFVVPPSTVVGNVTVQLQRSRCAVIFGANCGGLGELFLANATQGCTSTSPAAFRNICTSWPVLLPIR